MSAYAPNIRVMIKNDSGIVIPPRSIVVVTSVEISFAQAEEGVTIHHVTRYGCGQQGNVMVTGPTSIDVNASGSAYLDPFLYVSIDPAASNPAPGEEWGPKDDTWTVTKGGKGFFAQGYAETNGAIKRSMFLRTFVRAPATTCSSSSGNSTSSGSGSVTVSSSGSAACGCVLVVTSVGCSGGSLVVTYGTAMGCC